MKKVIILGTGTEALSVFDNFHKRKSPLPSFASFEKSNSFFRILGRDVIHISADNVLNYYYIIAVDYSEYAEYKQRLELFGLNEYSDFIYYEWIDKRMILLHGNCHFDVIEKILYSNQAFNNKFYIYPLPRIHKITQKTISKNILNKCDIFIHQPIRNNNPYGFTLSDDYIIPQLSNATIITVPNLYECGYAFFPQHHMPNLRNQPLNLGKDKTGIFPYAFELLDTLFESGLSWEDATYKLSQNDIIKEELILSNFRFYMNKIKKRENYSQVKIYDFIINNYQKYKLFYDPGHPTNIVFMEMCRQLFRLLEIDSDNTFIPPFCLNQCELPILECVKKTLCLNYGGVSEEIRRGNATKKIASKMDFSEYVKEYYIWCFGQNI